MVQSIGGIAKYSATDLDRLAQQLNQDGICIIPSLFEQKLIEEWAEAFEKLFRERQNQPGGLAPREVARYYLTLPWVSPFANELVFANPVIMGLLERVFYQEYVMVQLGVDVPFQGSDYQEIHRDFRPLFSDQIVTPLYALAVNFPLVEVTAENGPFQMARGTHVLLREEGLKKVASGEIPMESFYMQPGDVMVRSPLALHRGSPNRTNQPRPMVVMGYAMHWLHTPKVELTLQRDYYESLRMEIKQMLRCQVAEELPKEKVETYVNFKY
ncbi:MULTISPECIES: phytanoyl-CoA dioxygenase family protein [Nostoc]|uniref:Phytanoyl-CoA dioxygenase family protein n=1 Tax=Nostoc paludosum FACHB-159 TaxID=2692908 RepID=A0ABR8KGF4_9NOSO|nr:MULTISPECIES: phytanoyl-CoA dioxygenase family protein [Nostoc]MBD2679370.1 phytanoyl-CoA dioxygenase family protein [Nostoc sp. FACHB-857]MBD2737273.1 phytanoyl-CoA dioxygenase family protein [Nostoc paludosum FACHB-159]